MKRRPSGSGTVYRGTYRNKAGKLCKTATWWVAYRVNGRRVSEPSRERSKNDAETFLRSRIAARDAGLPAGPNPSPLTFEDLAAMVRADYKANDRKSGDRLGRSLKHLSAFFKGPASGITDDRITAYIAHRRATAKPATVNRELAALRRALRLAGWAGKLKRAVPHIKALTERNARKGFFEAEQFEAVMGKAPEFLRPLLLTYYITGWRKEELLSRERRHLDLAAGWLRLEPQESKNGAGRMFPLIPRLRVALEAQEETTALLERVLGKRIPWLFHRGGEQIKDFRGAWLAAKKAAGIPGRYIHDFRRTAVRNLERAGVPRSAAMAMVGIETESIYRRYAITDEGMLREAGEKLARLNRT